jgi:hypothetical protein
LCGIRCVEVQFGHFNLRVTAGRTACGTIIVETFDAEANQIFSSAAILIL